MVSVLRPKQIIKILSRDNYKKIVFVFLLFTVKLRAVNIIKYDKYNDLVMINDFCIKQNGIEKCFFKCF